MAHSVESGDLVLAGIVGAARGLKGEVFVEIRTDRADEVFEVGSRLLVEQPESGPGAAPGGKSTGAPRGASAARPAIPSQLTVERASVHGGRWALTFEQVQTREEAEALRGAHLMTEAQEEDDAWYPNQLEGLVAVDREGNRIGTVAGIAQGAAHDLLLVRVDADGHEAMVPFVYEIVPEVSVEEGRVVINGPEGLFD